jgi:hypothetical protein
MTMSDRRTAFQVEKCARWCTFAIIACLCHASAAFAQALPASQAVPAAPKCPKACSSQAKWTTKYNNGLSAGQQKADAFFASAEVAKSPKKLQNKLNKVFDKLHDYIREIAAQDTSDNRRCRVQGLADGFVFRLAQLLGQCILDGAQWGQFSADLYCELSIELDGLGEPPPFTRPPVGLCGTLFQQVCGGVYSYVASEGEATLQPAVQSFVSSHGVTLSTYPECSEFTEGAFAAIFKTSEQTDCAYGAQ